MRRERLLRFLMFLPLFVLGFALFGFIVMSLWNGLMPAMFGWKPITYWQAWGFLILCKILFGGFYGPGGRAGYRMRERMAERVRERMAERWEQMTPEEQEAFRRWFRDRWAGGTPPERSEI